MTVVQIRHAKKKNQTIWSSCPPPSWRHELVLELVPPPHRGGTNSSRWGGGCWGSSMLFSRQAHNIHPQHIDLRALRPPPNIVETWIDQFSDLRYSSGQLRPPPPHRPQLWYGATAWFNVLGVLLEEYNASEVWCNVLPALAGDGTHNGGWRRGWIQRRMFPPPWYLAWSSEGENRVPVR